MAKPIVFRHESASANLHIWDDNRSTLSEVFAEQPGLGHGTELLRKVAAYADLHNLHILIAVQQFFYRDNRGLNNQQLVSFYSKFGFERIPDTKPIQMIRIPVS